MPRRQREDDDDEERPRPKRRRRDEDDDDDEPTAWDRYRSSATRYVILGALIVAMLVLAFFLVQKQLREGG